MNKRYREDIQSFLDYTEGKITNPTTKALKIYRKYEKKLKDIDTWPDIFGDLYGGIYVCHMGGTYYTIDGVHDCFPKTSYKSIQALYESHQKGIPLTLRSVWEHFYNGVYDCFLEEYSDYAESLDSGPDRIVSDFYDIAFKGGNPADACFEALELYEKYKTENLYNPELWPEIFNSILKETFIRKDKDGYYITDNLGFFSNTECGTYEEVYRTFLGWGNDSLDFRDVWTKFYRRYIEMREALKEFDSCDDYE